MKKQWCKHFVPFSGDTWEARSDAANWALKKFGTQSVDIMYNDPRGRPGFWFEHEKDAVLFTLKWSVL